MSPSTYGSFYSTNPESHPKHELPYGHPQPTYSSEKRCPVSFAHKISNLTSATRQPSGNGHEYLSPKEGDVRSVCPALNTMANHGYIPRDGRNLTFFTIFYGLKECYGLSTPLAIVLTLGGFLLIGRFPICLPFTVPALFAVRNPDGSRSQPGVIDLKLIGRHGGVEHNASLVHEDCPMGSKYPSIRIRHDWVGNLVGDVLPPVKGYVKDTESDASIHSEHVASACSCSSHVKDIKESDEMDETFMSSSSLGSIASQLEVPRSVSSHRRDATDSSSVTVVEDPEDAWRQFATKTYEDTLVSAADVGRMRARREREVEGKGMNSFNCEIARGEMAIILGVWEKSSYIKESGQVKKGIPLPYLLTWLAEERLPEGWKPDHVQGLLDVVKRSKAIRRTADAIGFAGLY